MLGPHGRSPGHGNIWSHLINLVNPVTFGHTSSTSVNRVSTLCQLLSTLVNTGGQQLVNFGQLWPTLVNSSSTVGQLWSTLVNFGQRVVNIWSTLVNLGLVNISECTSGCAQMWSTVSNFSRYTSRSFQIWSTFGQHWSTLVNASSFKSRFVSKIWSTFGQLWSTLVNSWSTIGQQLANCGQLWSTLVNCSSFKSRIF